MVTAGLAKEIEEVNQYAAPMYAPTARPTAADRPARTRAKITRTRTAVATTSPSRVPGVTRSFVERLIGMANIAFASAAPPTAPVIWEARYAPISPGRSRSPSARARRVTTGLKWAPQTVWKIRISTANPSAVATLFWNNWRPMSAGDRRWAASPDPMTTATSSPVPRSSASARRHSGGTRLAFIAAHLDANPFAQSTLSQ